MKNTLNYKLLNSLILLVFLFLFYNFIVVLDLQDRIIEMLVALTPFYIAYTISWIMHPVGVKIKEKFNVSESLAHFLAILLNLIILLSIVFILIPLIILQLSHLALLAPQLIEGIKSTIDNLLDVAVSSGNQVFITVQEKYSEFFSINTLAKYYQVIFGSVQSVSAAILSTFSSAIGVVIQIVVGYIMSFYFARDVKKFNGRIIGFFEQRFNFKSRHVLEEVSLTISAYIRGLILDCTLVSVIVTIGLSIIGVPSALLFGVFCGLFNIIPYIGPIIGGIPVMIIALSNGFVTFLLSLLVVFGTQFFEAYFLQPKIMSDAVELHPVSILVGLLIFANLFGPVGLIISTPIMASINVFLKYSKYDISL